MIKYLPLFLFFILAGQIQASKKFASPNGSANNSGISPDQAWTLDFALGNSSPLVPGDSLVLTDGIFEGNFTSTISGTAENPIVVLAQNEGKAIIDVGKERTTGTGLIINGSYTWFVGIHVTSSSLIRKSDASNGFATILYESGISVFGDNNKIINCWIYDVVGGGLGLWRSGLNVEVYGSVVFNNGSQDEPRGTGHGMYIQHDQPAQPKVIENNFVFQNASQGINIFTTNPENSGVIVKRNVSFNTGVIATFNPFLFRPPHNLSIGSQNNVNSEMEVISNLFYSDLQGGRLSTNDVSNVTLGRTYSPNRDISFNDNILFGGRNQIELQPLEGLSLQRNKLLNVHGNFFAFLGNSSSFPNATWDSNVYSNITNTAKPFQGLTFQEWKAEYRFDLTSIYSISPSSTREVLITQNKYDPNRFHVSILNFTESEIVQIDFSAYPEFKNRNYEIRDVQNPFDQTQKSVGSFGGASILFPMNWTKSLQPKGNMPFQAVHTDLTFGTFLLVFEKGDAVPEVKDSVALFLNVEGKAFLTSQDFLVEQPSEPFTYSSSKGFDFACSNLGMNEVTITSKNTRTGETWVGLVKVWVQDNLPPVLVPKNFNANFDVTVGSLILKPEDFISVLSDNCGIKEVTINKTIATCADLGKEIPVAIRAVDASGNVVEAVAILTLNIIETKKISISPAGPILKPLGQTVELTLGNEFEYTVSGWYKNGVLIPNQKEKKLIVSTTGVFFAKLSPKEGCILESKEVKVEFTEVPFSQIKEIVELPLDELGKASLKPEDVFVSWPPSDPNLDIKLSQSEFTCSDIGEKQITITIKNQTGQTWEEKTIVKVQDKLKPVIIPKNFNVDFDVTVGSIALKPADFIAELTDNCGVKEVTINKTIATCADLGKEIQVQIRAVDTSGNVKEAVAILTLTRIESKKISISPAGPILKPLGQTVELTLGNEFEYTVSGWYKNGVLIPNQKEKKLIVSTTGVFFAKLSPKEGCILESKEVKVEFTEVPFPQIKEIVTLPLDESGKASLKPENVFVSWPPSDPNLDIKLSQSEFTCSDIGEKQITITIKNQTGQTWEEKTIVKVQDKLKPVIIPKNFNVDFDVTVGSIALKPADFIAELTDNCGVKEVTINKTSATCEDLGKEIPVAIRAVDASGNVVEAVAVLTLNRIETKKVIISGDSEFCEGNKGQLTLNSEAQFEVIRWRRDGVEIEGQKGKTLEIEQGGKYHAVIRYAGGCLSETNIFVVERNPLPKGEIEEKGNVLTAPAGSFNYQWFRNGELIPGATSRELVVNQMGEFTVELTSEAGCKAKLKSAVLTISGLGSNWVVEPEELKIYPNPASRYLEVEIISDQINSVNSIKIFGMDGKEVTSSVIISKSGSNAFNFDITKLANGTYLVYLKGDEQRTFFGKFIKNE